MVANAPRRVHEAGQAALELEDRVREIVDVGRIELLHVPGHVRHRAEDPQQQIDEVRVLRDQDAAAGILRVVTPAFAGAKQLRDIHRGLQVLQRPIAPDATTARALRNVSMWRAM